MTVVPRGFDLRPAMVASALLHVAVLGAGFVAWRAHEEEPEKLVTSVPVTLVSAPPAPQAASAPTPDPGPAEPTPPIAPPTPAAEPSPPVASRPPPPAPPRARAAPQPAPGGAKPAAPPAAAKPRPPAPQPEPSLDLDALAKRLAQNAPRRPTAPTPQPQAAGSGGASPQERADALAALAAKLQDLWNPNCQAEGGDTINVRVRFELAPDGGLVGQPQVVGGGGGSPLVRAAEDRAVRAVHRGAPYEELPAELRGQAITVRFDARRACAG